MKRGWACQLASHPVGAVNPRSRACVGSQGGWAGQSVVLSAHPEPLHSGCHQPPCCSRNGDAGNVVELHLVDGGS